MSDGTLIEQTIPAPQPLTDSEDAMTAQLDALEREASFASTTLHDQAAARRERLAAIDRTRGQERDALVNAMRSSPTGIFREDELRRFDAVTEAQRDLQDTPELSRAETRARETASRLKSYARRVQVSTDGRGIDLSEAEERDAGSRLSLAQSEAELFRLDSLLERFRSAVQRGDRVAMHVYSLTVPKRLEGERDSPAKTALRGLVAQARSELRAKQASPLNVRATKAANTAGMIEYRSKARKRETEGDPVGRAYLERIGGTHMVNRHTKEAFRP